MNDSYSNHPMLRKLPKKREKSSGEETMAQQLTIYKIPFEREVKFYPLRNWKFDFRITNTNIAIEIEGSIWVGGGHSRGSAIERDMEKFNHAAIENWRVLRFSTGMVKSGAAIDFIKRIKSLGVKEP
jgi:very-short-patch-repair endonuclease